MLPRDFTANTTTNHNQYLRLYSHYCNIEYALFVAHVEIIWNNDSRTIREHYLYMDDSEKNRPIH